MEASELDGMDGLGDGEAQGTLLHIELDTGSGSVAVHNDESTGTLFPCSIRTQNTVLVVTPPPQVTVQVPYIPVSHEYCTSEKIIIEFDEVDGNEMFPSIVTASIINVYEILYWILNIFILYILVGLIFGNTWIEPIQPDGDETTTK
jgi:hypothetical protein